MSKWHTTEFCENCAKEFCCTNECKYHLLHRIKQARLEMEDYNVRKEFDGCSDLFKLGVTRGLDLAVEILDKLIAEVEG